MGCLAFVDGKVVENDDIASRQCRSELCLDIGIEGGPVHRMVDDPWRGEPEASQSGDEGLCVPMAEGRIHDQPLAAGHPATQAHHLGIHRGFIKEDKAMRLQSHPRLTFGDPRLALRLHRRACAFRRHQRFFYM